MRRPDGGTQPLRTAEELIAENQNARRVAMEKLLHWRQHWQQTATDFTSEQLQQFNHTLRSMIQIPPKLTAEYCRREASQAFRYAKTPIDPNPLDTEYYSACGWEDGQLMQRDYELDYAIEMFRVWKWLKAQEG